MKKLLFILSIIFLVLCTAACSTPDLQSFDNSSSIPNVPSLSLEQTTIKFVNPFGAEGVGNANGYYYLQPTRDGNLNIKFIDYKAQQSVYLCSRIECTHKDDTCTSFVTSSGIIPALMVTEQKLYLVYGGINDSGKDYPKIISLDFNGSSRKEILNYNQTAELGTLLTDNKYLYTIKTQVNQTGDTVGVSTELIKIDLLTGEELSLFDLKGETSFIVDAKDSTLYIQTISQKENATSNTDIEMKYLTYDIGTSKSSEMFTTDPNKGQVVKLENGIIYTIDVQSKKLVRSESQNSEPKTICENYTTEERVSGIYIPLIIDNHMMINDIRNTGTDAVYDGTSAVNLETGHVQDWPLTYELAGTNQSQLVSIAARYDDFFLVVNSREPLAITYASGDSFVMYTPKYALISKQDFWAGNPNFIELQP